jgi:hypothetical protein
MKAGGYWAWIWSCHTVFSFLSPGFDQQRQFEFFQLAHSVFGRKSCCLLSRLGSHHRVRPLWRVAVRERERWYSYVAMLQPVMFIEVSKRTTLVLGRWRGLLPRWMGLVEGSRRSNRLGTPIHPLWVWVGCVDLLLHHPAIWLLVASNLIGETANE